MVTKTPPHLKWLLNERAALAGELDRLDAQINALLKPFSAKRDRLLVKISALDLTMARFEENLRPDAGGVVHAWAGKYGDRGSLKDFIVEMLRKAAPLSLDSHQITSAVAAHFQVDLEVRGGFARFQHNSIRRQLTKLLCAGLIERLSSLEGHPALGVWRWKPPSVPTLDDLREREAIASAKKPKS